LTETIYYLLCFILNTKRYKFEINRFWPILVNSVKGKIFITVDYHEKNGVCQCVNPILLSQIITLTPIDFQENILAVNVFCDGLEFFATPQ